MLRVLVEEWFSSEPRAGTNNGVQPGGIPVHSLPAKRQR